MRADTGREFLASTDIWFRPVWFANGPDGALYVLDMYRYLVEATETIPPSIVKHLDVGAGFDKGKTEQRKLYVGKTGDNRKGCNLVILRAGNHFWDFLAS